LDKRRVLETRARILNGVRGWFLAEGFLEVETPTRVRAPGQEVHLDAFAAGGDRYLITSPEYHMKRLVAAGLPRIFQVARVFRAEEAGPHHLSEFTMIEWYRAHAPLSAIADDCEALLHLAAATADRAPHHARPATRTTVAALVRQHAGVELRGDETLDELRGKLTAAGHDPRGAGTWDDVFFQLFLDRVEPRLRVAEPTFVFDWPVPLAALARRRDDNPAVAERFELYAGGLELANAFGELTDPVEQRRRFLSETAERRARGKTTYPLDEKLLSALAVMPPTSGVAMGFDRLVMWATGVSDIAEVVAFAAEEV
jgi:lysyl-tRNA synthetase class 2